MALGPAMQLAFRFCRRRRGAQLRARGPGKRPRGTAPPRPAPRSLPSAPRSTAKARAGGRGLPKATRGETRTSTETLTSEGRTKRKFAKKITITKKPEAPSLVQSPTASRWEQHGLRDCPEPVDVLALPPASRPQSGKAAAASCAPWLLARCEEIPDRFKFGEPAHLSVHVCPPSVDVQMLPKMAAAASFMPSLLEAIAFHDLHVLTLGQ